MFNLLNDPIWIHDGVYPHMTHTSDLCLWNILHRPIGLLRHTISLYTLASVTHAHIRIYTVLNVFYSYRMLRIKSMLCAKNHDLNRLHAMLSISLYINCWLLHISSIWDYPNIHKT